MEKKGGGRPAWDEYLGSLSKVTENEKRTNIAKINNYREKGILEIEGCDKYAYPLINNKALENVLKEQCIRIRDSLERSFSDEVTNFKNELKNSVS